MDDNKQPLEQVDDNQSIDQEIVPENVVPSESDGVPSCGEQSAPSTESEPPREQPTTPTGWQQVPPEQQPNSWAPPPPPPPGRPYTREPQNWYDMPPSMTPPMPPVPPTPPVPPVGQPGGWQYREDAASQEPAPQEVASEFDRREPEGMPQPPMPDYDEESHRSREPIPPQNKRGIRTLAIILAIVILFVGGVFAGYVVGHRGGWSTKEDTPTDLPTSSTAGSINADGSGSASSFDIQTGTKDGEALTYEAIAAKVCPSIVNITIYSADGQGGSYASGVIMDAQQGYVVTNDHIYSEIPNAKFLITLNNGTEFRASFVSGDSRSDIAILKIDNPQGLVAAEFNAQTLQVGESVLAIGQSYGYADTVSNGIVSAVNRRVALSSGSYSERYIQTTAAINPGNSGGALVNMHGQIVGITSAKIASNEVEGLGFAIPTERVLSIVQNLQQNGKVVGRAKLGITYTEVGTVMAEVNGTPTGLYIHEITADSGLYGKGYTEGDIITAINGKKITIAAIVLDIIEDSQAGDTIELGIYRAATQKTETVKVQLVEAESGSSYVVSSTPQGNNLPHNPFG